MRLARSSWMGNSSQASDVKSNMMHVLDGNFYAKAASDPRIRHGLHRTPAGRRLAHGIYGPRGSINVQHVAADLRRGGRGSGPLRNLYNRYRTDFEQNFTLDNEFDN